MLDSHLVLSSPRRNGRFRRNLAARLWLGESPLSEPTAAAQPSRCGRLFLPHCGHCLEPDVGSQRGLKADLLRRRSLFGYCAGFRTPAMTRSAIRCWEAGVGKAPRREIAGCEQRRCRSYPVAEAAACPTLSAPEIGILQSCQGPWRHTHRWQTFKASALRRPYNRAQRKLREAGPGCRATLMFGR